MQWSVCVFEGMVAVEKIDIDSSRVQAGASTETRSLLLYASRYHLPSPRDAAPPARASSRQTTPSNSSGAGQGGALAGVGAVANANRPRSPLLHGRQVVCTSKSNGRRRRREGRCIQLI